MSISAEDRLAGHAGRVSDPNPEVPERAKRRLTGGNPRNDGPEGLFTSQRFALLLLPSHPVAVWRVGLGRCYRIEAASDLLGRSANDDPTAESALALGQIGLIDSLGEEVESLFSKFFDGLTHRGAGG